MSWSKIFNKVFDNAGAGPLINPEILPASQGGFYPGEIRLWSIPIEVLQTYNPNWLLCNGDLYPQASAVGQALAALNVDVRSALGITLSAGNYNVPNMFTSGGLGYFIRAADGTTRTLGSVQTDAIRNITAATTGSHSSYGTFAGVSGTASGAFTVTAKGKGATVGSGDTCFELSFSASKVVPTAAENRPVNIGFEPCIYLEISA
jgi:hypothetical protein